MKDRHEHDMRPVGGSTAGDGPRTFVGAAGQDLVVGVGDGSWTDLADEPIVSGRIERVVLLPGGTVQGNATVEILVRLKDGALVHANTTWRLWEAATRALAASQEV